MNIEQREVIESILKTEPDQPIIIHTREREVLKSMLDDEEYQFRRLAHRRLVHLLREYIDP